MLVHDAARPFASRGLVERVASRAAAGRAVVPGLAVQDTLKEIDGERVVATHDRSRFIAAQTPQGFPRSLLREALAATGGDATDCAALCERLGAPVSWVAGEPLNRKITDADDWSWAERVIESGWIRWEATA
jgi:2-C-methyl-D-erythritol 4-phosphate cytidylyltransferase